MSAPAVVHADNHLLVLAKPAGVPTVPDASGDESLLDQGKDWIAREYAKPGAVFLGVVHRLDRPVSGVVVFARTSKAAARLAEAFRSRAVEKLYWGVSAEPRDALEERVEEWLVKDRAKNHVRVAPAGAPGAKRAVTHRRLLELSRGRALWALEPETGRPHQLRVAMSGAGCPLLGDLRYGAREPLPDASVALHALRLALDHPTRDERLVFEVPPPALEVWSFEHTERARRAGVRVDVAPVRGGEEA